MKTKILIITALQPRTIQVAIVGLIMTLVILVPTIGYLRAKSLKTGNRTIGYLVITRPVVTALSIGL